MVVVLFRQRKPSANYKTIATTFRHRLGVEANLNRREITEPSFDRLPGRDFGNAGACAGQNNIPASKLFPTTMQCFD
jgi:hypothetical protein